MANFFIAVGGTGQMVAMAYSRLRKLMPWCNLEEINMFHMDKDVISDYTVHAENSECIDPLPLGALNTFGDHFTDPAHASLCVDILDSLFTTEEQSTPIKTGMYARPPVGATVLMDMLNNPGVIMKQLLNGGGGQDSFLTDGNNHTVIICGSAMGGTGAGGVPSLAQYIDKRLKSLGGKNRNSVKIYVFYFLKHFGLPAQDANDKTIRIENDRITTNAESGMCYMGDQIAKGTNGCLVLGLDTTSARDYEAVGKQQEQSQPLYILASLYAQKAFTDNNDLFADGENIYAHGVDNNANLFNSAAPIADNGIPVKMDAANVMPLDELIRLNSASVNMIDKLLPYLHSSLKGRIKIGLPGIIYNVIRTLARQNNLNEKDVANMIDAALQERNEEIKKLIKWYADSSTDSSLSLKAVAELTTPDFLNIRDGNPVNFFRECLATMGALELNTEVAADSVANVSKQLVNSIFSTLKTKFFN